MAKKRIKKESEEELEDDIGDLEEEEVEIELPKITKKSPKDEKELEETFSITSELEEEEDEEELEFELEKKPEFPDYKYLDLKIHEVTENNYEIEIIGQSHGFCNILVKHLLNIEGVNIAAYKMTGLEPPKIYLSLKNGHKIKDILHKGIESLREEVIEVKKHFQKLM
ncbi:MAG: hypothetical protein EU529_14225 [Promethearchaeota archaeon]|nr:MAG: hypothetical protein EU529_14225 [Candidatus Lokiarchaeota archaeon]